MATLTIDHNDGNLTIFRLGRRPTMIGRQEGLMLQLDDHEKLISRRHLQIRFDEQTGGYFALDLRSENGVYINGRRIETELKLADGDFIQVGRRIMRFFTADSPDALGAMANYQAVGERDRSTICSPPLAA